MTLIFTQEPTGNKHTTLWNHIITNDKSINDKKSKSGGKLNVQARQKAKNWNLITTVFLQMANILQRLGKFLNMH